VDIDVFAYLANVIDGGWTFGSTDGIADVIDDRLQSIVRQKHSIIHV